MNDWQIGMLALRGEPFDTAVAQVTEVEEKPKKEPSISRADAEAKLRSIFASNEWIAVAELSELVGRSKTFIRDFMRTLPIERKRSNGNYFARLVN